MFMAAAFGWYLYNLEEDLSAGQSSQSILEKLDEKLPDPPQPSREDSMHGAPAVTVDGKTLCGKIKIESLGIELPVFDEWNYERLSEAPCRYSGSAASDDLIIAGHNYRSHFGKLSRLKEGDRVVFTDASGKEYVYTVKEMTALDGTAVTDMKAGEWALTLFTCTESGSQRTTVRCERA